MSTVSHLIGMLRAPRQTLTAALEQPRTVRLAALILVVCAAGQVGFLMTPTGRLAALDQQVRQLESVGVVVTDQVYGDVRAWQPYRPLVSAATILVGWPLMWVAGAGIIQTVASRTRGAVTLAQVLTVLVYASSVFALRAVVTTPINFARESLGGSASLTMMLPGLGDATFAARLFGAIDLFVVWWVALASVGLAMLYQSRAMAIARWLFGVYATGAVALALTQALRGGV